MCFFGVILFCGGACRITIRLKMASLKSSKLHFVMFPWFAFGHMTPYLHLSNMLAERGNTVSFLLPRGAQPKMEHLSLNQDLIRFFPLRIPHIDGLPSGAETTFDVPFPSLTHLATALDQTRDQVEAILRFLKPDFVFFDFAFWVPSLAHNLGIKSIYYSVLGTAAQAMAIVPSFKIGKDWTLAKLMQPPPGYPSSKIKLLAHEARQLLSLTKEFGSGLTLHERLTTSMKDCDAIAMRTCHEIEGPFCDYIAQQYAKSVLLTGPVLPKTEAASLEERWAKWLNNFKPSSVVFCALGSEVVLEKDQFQELLLGFELAQLPFLVALKPPQGCATIEEALPEGFSGRVQGRGLVHGGWVQQPLILGHPSVGCFVSHCGLGSMWESLLNDCQIVLLPFHGDQNINARFMVKEINVAVEVERAENWWFTKESLSEAIGSVMDEDSKVGSEVKSNHAKLKEIVLDHDKQGGYIDSFLRNLQDLLE